jgi:hypothetical protein
LLLLSIAAAGMLSLFAADQWQMAVACSKAGAVQLPWMQQEAALQLPQPVALTDHPDLLLVLRPLLLLVLRPLLLQESWPQLHLQNHQQICFDAAHASGVAAAAAGWMIDAGMQGASAAAHTSAGHAAAERLERLACAAPHGNVVLLLWCAPGDLLLETPVVSFAAAPAAASSLAVPSADAATFAGGASSVWPKALAAAVAANSHSCAVKSGVKRRA